MGYVGDKFLSGFVQHFHPVQHLIKCIGDKLCLCIILYVNVPFLVSVCDILNGFGNFIKRFDQYAAGYIRKYNHNQCYKPLKQHAASVQIFDGRRYFSSRNTHQHNSLQRFLLRTFYGYCQLQIIILFIISAGSLSLQTPDYIRGDEGFSLIQPIGIFHNFKIIIDQQNPAIVNI